MTIANNDEFNDTNDDKRERNIDNVKSNSDKTNQEEVPKNRKDKSKSFHKYYENMKKNIEYDALSDFVKNANDKINNAFDKFEVHNKPDDVNPNNIIEKTLNNKLNHVTLNPEIQKIIQDSLETTSHNIKKWFENNPERATQVIIFNEVQENVNTNKYNHEGNKASDIINFYDMLTSGKFDKLSVESEEILTNNKEQIELAIDEIKIPSHDELIAYYISKELFESHEIKEVLNSLNNQTINNYDVIENQEEDDKE